MAVRKSNATTAPPIICYSIVQWICTYEFYFDFFFFRFVNKVGATAVVLCTQSHTHTYTQNTPNYNAIVLLVWILVKTSARISNYKCIEYVIIINKVRTRRTKKQTELWTSRTERITKNKTIKITKWSKTLAWNGRKIFFPHTQLTKQYKNWNKLSNEDDNWQREACASTRRPTHAHTHESLLKSHNEHVLRVVVSCRTAHIERIFSWLRKLYKSKNERKNK